MKYYQHGETGRVVATENELSGEWYEIEENQYKESLLTDLEKRVQQFNSLSLPGQGMAMHMGTSYLVNDLFREVQRLRTLESRPTRRGADFGRSDARRSPVVGS